MKNSKSIAPRPRYEAFDHLRGLAAVAVVVLHGAYAYSRQPLAGLLWPVPLDEPSRLADLLFWAIEGCVMPVFFLMSGFFLAHSLARQAPGKVFGGRTRRLLVPMAAIGIPVLAIDLWIWGFGLVQMDQVTWRQYLTLKYPREIRADLFGPAHLWYVEYLWAMCAGICLAWWICRQISDSRLPIPDSRYIWRTWRKLNVSLSDPARPQPPDKGTALPLLGLGTLAALITIILACEPAIVVGFQHGWLPALPKFFHGLMFVLLGMLLQHSDRLLASLKTSAPALLAGAAAVFCLALPRFHTTLRAGDGTAFDLEMGILLAAYALLATCGIVGGCLRWLGQPRPLLAALGAASFWIYIVHHPLLGLAHLGLRPVPLPAVMKFLLATGGTLAICLMSYRYLVQDGVIGQLLEGIWPWPKREKGQPVPAPIEEKPRRAA